jgi:hypothetical protein
MSVRPQLLMKNEEKKIIVAAEFSIIIVQTYNTGWKLKNFKVEAIVGGYSKSDL